MQSDDPLAMSKQLSAALEHAGHLDFYKFVLHAFGELLPDADLYVLRYNSYSKPDLLFYDGHHQASVDLYLQSLYKIDPFFQLCATGSQSGVVLLRDFNDSSLNFQNYFSFMSGVGISENLTIMYPVPGGSTIVLAWDFLQEDYTVPEELLETLKRFYRHTQPYHSIQIQALLDHQGSGLLDQTAEAGWIIVSSDQDLVCASDTCSAAARKDAEHQLTLGAFSGGDLTLDRGAWVADRMTPNNAIAPNGWFLQERLQPYFTGPRSFDEALERLFKSGVTPREQDVIKLSLQGLENQAIANSLGLSHQVVKNYKASIYDKLDVTSERELFRRFLGVILEEEEHAIW